VKTEVVLDSQRGRCHSILTGGGRVRPRTTLIVLGVLAVGTGLFFGWSSLAALGLTTFIVSLLPCLAMCALGVCAARMGRKDAGETGEVSPNDGTRKETP